MWCVKCGKEIQDGSVFCTACGADLREVQQESQATSVGEQSAQVPAVYGFFKNIFSSNLFLAACILVTVYAVAGLFDFSLDVVLDILCAVSFWLLRQSAISDKFSGYITPLKILSVSATIIWVINWVAVGLLGLASLIMLFFANIFTGESFIEIFEAEQLPAAFLGLGWTIIGVVFIIITVAVVFLNVFCFGNFRKCAKSFVTSAETGVIAIDKFAVVKAWLLVNAILETLSIFDGNWTARIATAASAAFFYVLFFWAKDLIKDQQI